ncbi:hypothetical protein I203_100954 [Kwoniella mangroviensis CBS 8507]|uniref:uncharacterized protein n=1 Tax=Kwoniella mangroviensis CBS 8507 TaxID=1296122 RepID=UPI00080D4F30|nr:uncharacterized protein I203_02595 [Kwoniella mangroviensis CBS 8507]OCF67937.1 hypothetical protein I203_02595 [Kwoniella mangroviensis CBS 8507]
MSCDSNTIKISVKPSYLAKYEGTKFDENGSFLLNPDTQCDSSRGPYSLSRFVRKTVKLGPGQSYGSIYPHTYRLSRREDPSDQSVDVTVIVGPWAKGVASGTLLPSDISLTLEHYTFSVGSPEPTLRVIFDKSVVYDQHFVDENGCLRRASDVEGVSRFQDIDIPLEQGDPHHIGGYTAMMVTSKDDPQICICPPGWTEEKPTVLTPAEPSVDKADLTSTLLDD